MIAESYLSTRQTGLPEVDYSIIAEFIAKRFPTPKISERAMEEIIDLAVHDKKNKDGVINAVLLARIGTPEIDVPISKSAIAESLKTYNQAFTK
jgi:3-dehydroquinate synthetase